MKFAPAILLSILLQITATVAAPAEPFSKTLVSRKLLLPKHYGKQCRTTQLGKGLEDVTGILSKGFADVKMMAKEAIKVDPNGHGSWFQRWLPIEDYHLFLKLCQAVQEFDLPEGFDTILVDCEAPTPACDRLKEPDHTTSRLAVTNPEHSVIYICYRMWDFGHAEYRRTAETVSSSCGDMGQKAKTISHYQVLATTLAREIAHTGALIRRLGPPYYFTDIRLHAKIDRFGWILTHAYFQKKCGRKIDVGVDHWDYRETLANIEEEFHP